VAAVAFEQKASSSRDANRYPVSALACPRSPESFHSETRASALDAPIFASRPPANSSRLTLSLISTGGGRLTGCYLCQTQQICRARAGSRATDWSVDRGRGTPADTILSTPSSKHGLILLQRVSPNSIRRFPSPHDLFTFALPLLYPPLLFLCPSHVGGDTPCLIPPN
jgi:hypothetical protein